MHPGIHREGVLGGEGEEPRWGRRAEDSAFMGSDKPKGAQGILNNLGALLPQSVLSVLAEGTHEFFTHLAGTLGAYCVPGIIVGT